MARSERTRAPRNGGASAGQRAVRSRPRSALRQDQLTPPDQAEFVLCEQTILAVSRPIMLMPIAGGSLVRTLSRPASWHIDAVAGRPPHLLGLELDDPGCSASSSTTPASTTRCCSASSSTTPAARPRARRPRLRPLGAARPRARRPRLLLGLEL